MYLQALEREAREEDERASLIEYNLEAVDAAIAAVNEALAAGMHPVLGQAEEGRPRALPTRQEGLAWMSTPGVQCSHTARSTPTCTQHSRQHVHAHAAQHAVCLGASLRREAQRTARSALGYRLKVFSEDARFRPGQQCTA